MAVMQSRKVTSDRLAGANTPTGVARAAAATSSATDIRSQSRTAPGSPSKLTITWITTTIVTAVK